MHTPKHPVTLQRACFCVSPIVLEDVPVSPLLKLAKEVSSNFLHFLHWAAGASLINRQTLVVWYWGPQVVQVKHQEYLNELEYRLGRRTSLSRIWKPRGWLKPLDYRLQAAKDSVEACDFRHQFAECFRIWADVVDKAGEERNQRLCKGYKARNACNCRQRIHLQ